MTNDDALPDVDVLDVFVIDERGRLATAEPWQRPAPPARPPRTEAPTVDEPPTTRRASPGSGSGPITTPPPPASRRPIGRHEARRAVFVDPAAAIAACIDLDLVHELPGVGVRARSASVDGSVASWRIVVRPGRWRRPVRAELCVHPSRSGVVTIIELRPRRLGGRVTARFARRGLAVADALSDRLTETLAPPG